MKSRFILVVFLAVLITGSEAIAAQDVYEHESWPYEGMPYFEVVKDKFELHETASSKSPVVMKLNIEKGSVMSFDFGVKELIKNRKQYGTNYGVKNGARINNDYILGKSIQKTIRPGVIRATTSGAIMFSPYNKGDVIEELLYLGEGVCLYRYDGKVFENDTCLFSDLQDGSLVQESRPVTEWWISIVKSGKIMGWVKIDEKSPLKMIETIK